MLTIGRVANLTQDMPEQGRTRCQFRGRCHRGCSYGAPFAGLQPEQQDAIVSLAQQRQLDGAGDTFFDTIKQLTITGYYTSEIGMTVEQVYLPVPGRYDGAYPYAEVGRLFSN